MVGSCNPTMDVAVSGNQIMLRAERAGTGNDRVYVVHFTATDATRPAAAARESVYRTA